VPSPTFWIRSLTIDKIVIENVKASIAPVAGELLLGQSFLTRFKSWSIDNSTHSLVLNALPAGDVPFGVSPAQPSGTEPVVQPSSTPPHAQPTPPRQVLLGPRSIYLFADLQTRTRIPFCRRHTMLSRRDRKSQSLMTARYGQPQGGAQKTLITFGVQRYTAIIAGGLMHIS
jgi:hypothetical protein